MRFKTNTSPFFKGNTNVSTVMLQVILALIPGTAVLFYFYSWGIITNILLSVFLAVTFEAIALKIRNRPLLPFLGDLSAVVTGWLFALTLPPLMPWWIIAVGIFFAIIIAKQLYGGLGYNPFNPAMVGFAVLIISYPFEMSQWIEPGKELYGFLDSLKIISTSATTIPDWDAITMATPLDEVKLGLRAGTEYKEVINTSYLKEITNISWFWSSLAFVAGGLWLLYKKVIHWQIPTALLASIIVVSGIMHLYSPENYATPLFHLFSGATMLGAFFIATDPVSASTTPLGKLIYGASIGFFIIIIRVWGNYPDSIAFSVLVMNMAVPMIDYYTQPRVLGHQSSIDTLIKKMSNKDNN